MASKTQGEAHALAARIGKVPGWRVAKPRSLNGAYKITAPDGEITQIHLSPSDTNWIHSVMRSLNKSGFEAAEKKAQEHAEKLKAADLEEQRRLAERKAAELSARSAMLQKAAGPYYAAPEEVPFDWYAQKHPAPWHR